MVYLLVKAMPLLNDKCVVYAPGQSSHSTEQSGQHQENQRLGNLVLWAKTKASCHRPSNGPEKWNSTQEQDQLQGFDHNIIRLKVKRIKDIYLLTYRPFSLRIQPWPKAEVALIKLIKTGLLKGFRINNLPQFWRHVCCGFVYLPLLSRKTSAILMLLLIPGKGTAEKRSVKFQFIATLLWYFIRHLF